jgi:hypothetical protein
MRYMLLIYNCEPPGPEEPGFEDAVARINAFAAECRRRGVLVGGDKLAPESTATTVRVRDGRTMITDGPFVETHEYLGGYYIVDCETLDEVLELTAICPFVEWGGIEVRPMAVVPGVDNTPSGVAAGGE